MRHPWILYEARSFRCNPTRIVYVGYNVQGILLIHDKDVKMMGGGIRSEFERILDHVWKSSFMNTILGVLYGSIEICSIYEFRFGK